MKNVGTCFYLLMCTPRMQSQQQELQQTSLISTNFPFGVLFKNICTYFKSLNLVCGKWLLKQLLNYFVQVFAEGLLWIFGIKLFFFFRPLTTSSIESRKRGGKNQGVLNYYSLCAVSTNRIDCGLQYRKEILAQLHGNNFYVC